MRTDTQETAVLKALEEREDDDPEVLLASALEMMDAAEWPPEDLCELLGLYAAARFGELNRAVPEELDRLLTGRFVSNRFPRIALAIEGFRALPAARAHAIARRGLEARGLRGPDLIPLAAHFDSDLFDAMLAKDDQLPLLDPACVGAFGARKLGLLLDLYEEADEYRRRDLSKGILVAMALMAEEPPEELDRFIDFGGSGTLYADDAELQRRAFERLPKERRNRLVTGALEEQVRPLQVLKVVASPESPALVESVLVEIFQDWRRVSLKDLRKQLDPLGAEGIEILERILPGAQNREQLFQFNGLNSVYDGEILERLRSAAGS